MALKPQTYAPDVHIAREGELGKEIFFLSRGKVEIISNDGKSKHGQLESGDYFGDLSLILGEKRTASVRALTYCEVFILNRTDFNRIKNEYSEFRDILTKTSAEKTDKISTLIMDNTRRRLTAAATPRSQWATKPAPAAAACPRSNGIRCELSRLG